MLKFLYTLITRENSAECDVDPRLWEVHPECNYLIRTNIKSPISKGDCWITGIGSTIEEAMKRAKFYIQREILKPNVNIELVGEESPTIIKR